MPFVIRPSLLGRIDPLACVFDCFPLHYLRCGQRGVALDACVQAVEESLVMTSCAVLHELNIVDTGDFDTVQPMKGVRVVAHVEEDFGGVRIFEDGLEGLAFGSGSREGSRVKDVDVYEVDMVLRENVELDDGDSAGTSEMNAFDIEVEGWGRGWEVVEGVEEGSEDVRCVDHG